jgi:MerR family transcriptional regulator, copper efflux regulator
MINEHYQIGEVAEMVGLSLRAIRYYEEIELVSPSGRTEGGFRLYTDSDVSRLRLVKALKPVGLSLETMGELVAAVDEFGTGKATDDSTSERIAGVLAVAYDGCDDMEESLRRARAALAEVAALVGEGAR